VKHVSSGQFELPLSAAEAIWLFTPEGERKWVPGWNPTYPAGDPSEAPGTVFMTAAHGTETIWLILELDRSGRSATYGRLTPGHHAGMVRVQCLDTRPGHSTVSVSYDMTLLGDSATSGFGAYAPAPFADMMQDWSNRIGTYLQTQIG
jgi:hypothetical protein